MVVVSDVISLFSNEVNEVASTECGFVSTERVWKHDAVCFIVFIKAAESAVSLHAAWFTVGS